ncbi:MAG: hypothetical protein IKI20_08585 [Lachnospiraceae bacterium]|nr:hypothetical protein [Lachnospiraceae bacterium]
MDHNKSNKIFKPVVFLLMACFIFILYLCNRIVIFMQDDLWYWTNLVTNERIQGVGDIVQSQVWHYNNWGGRTVAHTLLQFLLFGGGTLCNICNTVVFCMLSVFIAKAGKKWDATMILLAGSMLVAFNPNILETMLWQSGTANYLYMTMLSFPLVWIYIKQLSGNKDEEKTESKGLGILKALGVFLWGLLAGWTNENMGPTYFLIAVATVILYSRKLKKKIPVWMITGCISLLMGSAFMILAPGNNVRESEIQSLGSWKLDLCKRVLDYFKGSFEYLLPTIVVAIFVFILYRLVMKKKPDYATYMLLAGGIVSYLALALSPHVPDRAMFGSMSFLIWGSIRMLTEVFEETKKEHYKFFLTLFVTATALYRLFFFWAQGVGWYRWV